MKHFVLLVMLFVVLFVTSGLSFAQSASVERKEMPVAGGEYSKVLTRIAFGSCAKEYKPQPILSKVAEANSDLF
ncbi:MAG: hypothetical protein OEX19_10445, partial [Gammaproteobacteria bacterium]|nr:hypothetical protein [Gammaproteobacteria bacterium]